MFLSNIENDEARGISPMCTYTPSHFSFRGIESSYKFEKASSMGRASWRNPRKLWVRVPCLPPPTFRLHFAAQNVPILIIGTEEVVGSNPTADGLYLRIAQSGRAPKNTFRRFSISMWQTVFLFIGWSFVLKRDGRWGSNPLIHLATNFQRHREFLLLKTESCGFDSRQWGNSHCSSMVEHLSDLLFASSFGA